MKPVNTKLVLSALAIVAMFATPALARTQRVPSQEETVQTPAVAQYPEDISGMSHTGSQSNQFEHDHGFYNDGSRS